MERATLTLIVTAIRYNKLNADGSLSDEKLIDKNGNAYCVLEFSTPDKKYIRKSDGTMGTVKIPQQSVGGYSAWEKSNLPSRKGKPDFGWGLQVGEEVQGTIVKRQVTPYMVNGREVTTASVVTFADTADAASFELDVREQFRRKSHTLVETNNQAIADAANQANGVHTNAQKEEVPLHQPAA